MCGEEINKACQKQRELTKIAYRKHGYELQLPVSYLPINKIHKYAVGEDHVFPKQNGEDIHDVMKSETVSLISRAMVAFTNPSVTCPSPPAKNRPDYLSYCKA